MSRPKPTVLLANHDQKTCKIEQVLSASGIYAVFYQGKPINVRTLNAILNYPGPVYRRVSLSNAGHAFNLAERLNKLFNTTEFAVFRLTEGVQISEDDI